VGLSPGTRKEGKTAGYWLSFSLQPSDSTSILR